MQQNSTIELYFDDKPVRVRGELINLTDEWKASGSDSSKAPSQWLRSAQAIEFRQHLHDVGISHITQSVVPEKGSTKGGTSGGGGTWAHWHLAMAYAKYLSPAFHVKCNEIVRAHMEGRSAAPVLNPETLAAACMPFFERMLEATERRINATFEARLIEAKAADPRVAVVDYEGSLEVCDAEHIPAKGRGGFLRSLSALLLRATLEKGLSPRILAFGKNKILQFPVSVTTAWRVSDEGRTWVARVKHTLAIRQNGQTVLPFPMNRVRKGKVSV